MKTALTRLATVSAIALALLGSACTGQSPTDPGGGRATITVPSDPIDEVVKR